MAMKQPVLSFLPIGIAGHKRAGKDSVCSFLLERLKGRGISASRRAFADALKDECACMLSCETGVHPRDYRKAFEGEEKESYRPLLQWWGMWKRSACGEDYWTSRVEQYGENRDGVVIVPDVRLPDEIDWIRSFGGLVIQVVRVSDALPVVSRDSHVTETALDRFDDYDWTFHNDGTLEDLKAQVDEWAVAMLERRLGARRDPPLHRQPVRIAGQPGQARGCRRSDPGLPRL